MTSSHQVTPAGELSETTPEALLRWCESRKFTGTLRFSQRSQEHTLPLLAGQVEARGPEDPVSLSLEAFLLAVSGRYFLEQALPDIDDGERLGRTHLRGPIGAERIGDLMQYCEAVGLTGELRLEHDGRPGEGLRNCTATYQRGELASLTLDGRDDQDFSAIFAWTEGTWEVQAEELFRSESRPPPPPEPRDPLLRTLEVALADVLEKGARSRSPSRRPPSLRPIPNEAPPAPKALPQGAADTTIKVYFVKASGPAAHPKPPQVTPQSPTEPPPPAHAAPVQRPASLPSPPPHGSSVAPQPVKAPEPASTPARPTRPMTREELVLAVITVVGLAFAAWLLVGLMLRA